MNCPGCGAPMHLASGGASMRCDYCKNVVVLPADAAGMQFLDEVMQGLDCPACAIPLWNATIGGNKLCGCKHCNGMLISMGVMEPLIEHLREKSTGDEIPSPPDPADLHRVVNCPKCNRKMDVHFYMGGGGAIMATCENCEVNWLDGGMLMRIVHAPHGESSNSWGNSTPDSSLGDYSPDLPRDSSRESIGDVILDVLGNSRRNF